MLPDYIIQGFIRHEKGGLHYIQEGYIALQSSYLEEFAWKRIETITDWGQELEELKGVVIYGLI